MTDKSKKETLSKDTMISDDSDGSLSDYDCETCGVSFPNAKTFKNHVLGKKHRAKIAEAKLKSKYGNSDKDAESEEEGSDEDAEIHCDVCDKSFTGYVSYAAHVKGSGHAKNLKKQKLKKELDQMPEVIKDEEKGSDDDDDILPKTYARCSICQKEFQGPESFKAHVKSGTHLKKVKQAKTLENLKKEEGEHSDGEEIFSKCETCKKSFSGVVPYQIHMKSNVHKKNLDKKKIAEEIKEFCANTDFDEGYVCKECKKTFTDPLAFKCHLKNNSHEKQKVRDALSKFLDAYPEIVYCTPDDKEASEDGNSDESDPMFYLICKLCHVSFSGPASAQDHVKSKKHISTKKAKQLQKLLKERQNSSTNGNTVDKPPSSDVSNDEKKNSDLKNGTENSMDEFELI